jgi:hypothetical protein
LLAKDVNVDACCLDEHVVFKSFASKLAPTESLRCIKGRMTTLGFSCGLFVLCLREAKVIHDTVRPA